MAIEPMQWMRCGVSLALAAGVLAAGAVRARGQNNVFNPAALTADTAQVEPGYRFAPAYLNKIEGSVSYVGMTNQFSTSLMTPFGPTFQFGLSKDEKHYRLQDRREENKRLSLMGHYAISPGFNATATFTDSRVFNRSIAVGGSFQDFIINDNAFNAGLTYSMKHSRARVDGSALGHAVAGERTYKTDETVGGGVNGGVAYNLLRNRVIVQARGALRETSEKSRTTLREFSGLGASEDSVSSVVRVSVTDSLSLRVAYSGFSGERRFADQAQGSLGGQIGGAENVFEETELRDTRATMVDMNSHLWRGITIKLNASHEEQVNDYAIQKTRFSETVGDAVGGSVSYTTPWKTSSTVQFENRETLRNFGPQSVASYNEVRKRASIALQHAFTPTFRWNFNATTQILQSFYVRYDDNPRDRDQLDTNTSLRISSQPFSKVSADITLGYSSTQFINIDGSQSRNNRTRDLYELRPGFTYTMSPMLTISQTYGLVIEYTQYDFLPDDNFLDRNITLSNVFAFRPARRVDVRFDYGLTLHDKGSYLPVGPGGEELLDIEREDRRDRLVLRVSFRPVEHVTVFGENSYSRFRDRTVGTGAESITTDGTLQLGSSGDYDWGGGRKFKFTLTHVRRFSPFGSEKEKEYWDMRSELNLPL